MFKFLARRPLLFNVAIAIVFVLILGIVFMLSLRGLTKHGKSLTVPAVMGKTLSEATALLDSKGFNVVVQDSLFYDSIPPGMVIKQVPDPDEVVKVNRTVYVTINRFIPPDVEMPNLKGYSYRNAELVLRNLGLRVGDTTYKPDFAKNSILDQLFNGQSINPGTKIKMGSKIALVLGSGVGTDYVVVPDLVGRTFQEARTLLDANGLIVGAVIPDPDVKDTTYAFVYWQRPSPRTEDGKRLSIRPGQMIDVRLSAQKPVTDSVKVTQPVNPTEQQ